MIKSYAPAEFLFQRLRIRQVERHIPVGGVLVDIGCDCDQTLIKRMAMKMKKCIGIDIAVSARKSGNVEILQQDIQKKIDLPSNTANAITILAVLEHMKHPKDIIAECHRILKKDGVLLITVPSAAGRPILELFALVGIVRKEMIEQHENYFTKDQLRALCQRAGFRKVDVRSFEFGYNTFVKATK